MAKLLKRLIPVILLVALAVVVVAPNNAQPETAKAQSEPVLIRIFVGVGTGYHPDQQVGQNALADQWNSTHEDIKVQFEYHDNV